MFYILGVGLLLVCGWVFGDTLVTDKSMGCPTLYI